MPQIICALCGKNQRAKLLFPSTFDKKNISRSTYSARRLPDRVHFQINKCENCGLIFSSPILPLSKIAKLYRESACNYKEQIPYLIKTYMGLVEKWVKIHACHSRECGNPINGQKFNSRTYTNNWIPPFGGMTKEVDVIATKEKVGIKKKVKILEIGCGNGFFLKALRDRGFKQVYGVEPSSEMVKEAEPRIRKQIVMDIFRKNQFRAESFDIVLCFHTLDHLVDPISAVSEMHRILKRGGLVITVVHDTDGLSVKLFGQRSPIFDIEHIYLFNKNTISQLFKKAKFQIIEVKVLVNEYPLWYWWRMSGLPKVIKSIGSTLLKTLGIENSVLRFSGGNLYCIAQKV